MLRAPRDRQCVRCTSPCEHDVYNVPYEVKYWETAVREIISPAIIRLRAVALERAHAVPQHMMWPEVRRIRIPYHHHRSIMINLVYAHLLVYDSAIHTLIVDDQGRPRQDSVVGGTYSFPPLSGPHRYDSPPSHSKSGVLPH